ncbi:MAG: beta-lactamase family protein [Caldilineaceae bacterium]|nr:beta-lactamase family protein [Caldilineaceae bacterium]
MLTRYNPEDVGLSRHALERIPAHLNRYVDEGKLPGYLVLVARCGKAAYVHHYGLADVERQQPMTEETIFRIYSMTKPITSVALLQLYEQGHFQLDNPVAAFIPAFKDLQVYVDGEGDAISTKPPDRAVTFRDLFIHTAGFTYGLFNNHPVDQLYREHNVMGGTLEELIERVASLPLVFTPGSRWNYSVATDVLGYLVEIISGQPLDEYFAEHILGPLGMVDTAFTVPATKGARFAANYGYHEGGMRLIDDPTASPYLAAPRMRSGGGGLVSTCADYFRFAQMLLNRGELEGARILGRKTVELMTTNHLPNNGDLSSMGMPVFSETPYDGIGFGLGGSVLLDPAKSQILGSPGEFAWGGAASTAFWIDPVEEQLVIFLTQLMPSSTYPIRRELRVLTYGAIVD